MVISNIQYRFSAKVWQYAGAGGWHFLLLPVNLSKEIRDNFKSVEAAWGRLTVRARIGESEWKTAIWFDTGKNTYLLPLKADIRKKENLLNGKKVRAVVIV